MHSPTHCQGVLFIKCCSFFLQAPLWWLWPNHAILTYFQNDPGSTVIHPLISVFFFWFRWNKSVMSLECFARTDLPDASRDTGHPCGRWKNSAMLSRKRLNPLLRQVLSTMLKSGLWEQKRSVRKVMQHCAFTAWADRRFRRFCRMHRDEVL